MLPPHETAEHLGLVHTVAQRYSGCGTSFEDLVGAGSIGLVEAAARFEPERGLAFSTYAWPWIRKFILSALDCDTSPSALMSEVPSPHAETRNDHEAEVVSLLTLLDEQQHQVIERRFGLTEHHPHSIRETAKALGLSKSKVHRLEAAAIEAMKDV